MRNFQEAKDLMYRNIIQFSDGNIVITGILPDYNTNLGKLKITVDAIQAAAEEQKIDTKGITKYKLQLRMLLILLSADNARKLTSYAKLSKNPVLLSQVNYTETDFKRFSDESLKDYARIIYNSAESNVSLLENYDITVETQATFLGAINDFNEVLVSPNLVETVRKQATKKLVMLFKEGDDYVANMAAAVEIVRLKEPVFYFGFKTAQKVTIKGRVRMSVKVQTTDANDQPLPKVTVNVTLNEVVVLVKKTSAKGGFNLKSLAAGTYQFTFKKVGFADQTIVVNVNDGELTKLKVKMVNV